MSSSQAPHLSTRSADPWVQNRDLLHRLYVLDNRPAAKVKQSMEGQYGFPEMKLWQYESKFKELGLRKNFTDSELLSIDAHMARRLGKPTEALFGGRRLKLNDLRRRINRAKRGQSRSRATDQSTAVQPLPEGVQVVTPPGSPSISPLSQPEIVEDQDMATESAYMVDQIPATTEADHLAFNQVDFALDIHVRNTPPTENSQLVAIGYQATRMSVDPEWLVAPEFLPTPFECSGWIDFNADTTSVLSPRPPPMPDFLGSNYVAVEERTDINSMVDFSASHEGPSTKFRTHILQVLGQSSQSPVDTTREALLSVPKILDKIPASLIANLSIVPTVQHDDVGTIYAPDRSGISGLADLLARLFHCLANNHRLSPAGVISPIRGLVDAAGPTYVDLFLRQIFHNSTDIAARATWQALLQDSCHEAYEWLFTRLFEIGKTKAGWIEAVETQCLWGAVVHNWAEIAVFLLESGTLQLPPQRDRLSCWVDRRIAIYGGAPLLQAACRTCNPRIFQLLIETGADTNARNDKTASLLVQVMTARADLRDRLSCLAQLLKNGADPDQPPILKTRKRLGNLALASELSHTDWAFLYYADFVERLSQFSKRDPGHLSIADICRAAAHGVSALKEYLEHGEGNDKTESWRRFTLEKSLFFVCNSSIQNRVAVVRTLLAIGVDQDASTWWTEVRKKTINTSPEGIELRPLEALILGCGVEFSDEDSRLIGYLWTSSVARRSPAVVQRVVLSKNTDLLRYLVKSGIGIDAGDCNAFVIAARNNDFNMVDLLFTYIDSSRINQPILARRFTRPVKLFIITLALSRLESFPGDGFFIQHSLRPASLAMLRYLLDVCRIKIPPEAATQVMEAICENAQRDDKEVVAKIELLKSHGVNIFTPTILPALALSRNPGAEKVLEWFLDQELLSSSNTIGSRYYDRFLSNLIQSGKRKIADILIQRYDANTLPIEAATNALITAASQCELSIFNALLRKTAHLPISERYRCYNKALSKLCGSSGVKEIKLKILNILVASGADVNSKDENMSALEYAAMNGCFPSLSLLIRCGAKLSTATTDWGSNGRELDLAVEFGRLDMVEALLSLGAKAYLPGRSGYDSAMDVAKSERNSERNSIMADLIQKHVRGLRLGVGGSDVEWRGY